MTETLFLAARLMGTGIDAAVAAIVLVRLARRRRPKRIAVALLGAGVAAAVAFAVKLLPLAAAGLDPFGAIHLAYLDLVVVPSVLTLALAGFEARSGRSWVRRPLGVAALLVGTVAGPTVGLYATFIEPFAVRLETARIPVAPQRRPATPIRIGVLADIQTAHVTEYEHRVVDRLMAERPDVIVLPGDLFHGAPATFAGELEGLRRLMARLAAPAGVYFALGDADTSAELAAICEGTAVRVLVNASHRVEIHGRALTMAGVELDARRPEAVSFLRDFEGAPGDDLRVLLAHKPDALLGLRARTRIDLVIAGHTHGGQVQLPFLGPPLILSAVPRHIGAGGHHTLDGRSIYVSRGIGHEGGQAPRIRFLCPPEVSLLVLY